MSDQTGGDLFEETIEKTIINSFGWSIIEFEAVLFHKFLIAAGPASVITEEMFRRYLTKLESKGVISSIDFHGKRAWKKLVIDWDASMEDIRVSKEGIRPPTKEVSPPKRRPSERLVTESKAIAEDIFRTMQKGVSPEHYDDMRKAMVRHAIEMRRALSESRNEFIKYLDSNIPELKPTMEDILKKKGEEVLLLSLRLIGSEK